MGLTTRIFGRLWEISFLRISTRNTGNPVVPASGPELAGCIDEIVEIGDSECNFLTVTVKNPSGHVLIDLGVGVRLDKPAASIFFDGPGGAFFSRGKESAKKTLSYNNFGNEVLFPGYFEIDFESAKSALTRFFATSYQRPDNIQWQDWLDEHSARYE
ncbi:hypothetical protein D7D52_21330 [Nocardia yunnanensis]|uniref:Uncharacterized protein n=1 Tax=Nocardia yunnanensis TaxID=2382165 RepID=A0A386ZE82_9NOCA|nr:Imm1 family immunity protein [Nocardia yunnanensis]AYF75961.1 hypothetical protein D7D52_21330 [Nocardia yunnanensis]